MRVKHQQRHKQKLTEIEIEKRGSVKEPKTDSEKECQREIERVTYERQGVIDKDTQTKYKERKRNES